MASKGSGSKVGMTVCPSSPKMGGVGVAKHVPAVGTRAGAPIGAKKG